MSAGLPVLSERQEHLRVVGGRLGLLCGPGAALGLPVLVPLDDLGQEARLLGCLDEAVPEKLLGRRALDG